MQVTLAANRTVPEPAALRKPWSIDAAFWSAATLLGAVQAFANRHAMNSDGVTYLDMGDALFHGDWKAILNALWSPLYPAILGLIQFVFRPSPYLEFSVAHLTNFAIYIVALLSFTFFLRNLGRYIRSVKGGLPEWSVLSVGYSLFIWSSLCLIDLAKLSPDMTLSVFLYAATALLVRIRLGQDGLCSYAALGLLLGGGFLAKAAMLPLAAIWLTVSGLAARDLRKGMKGVAIAGTLFILVSAPYVVALSKSTGHFTFGDSGRLNYAWHVNGVPMYHWRGEPSGSGIAKHPTRELLADPPIYEFGTPVGGTYPVWFDAAYWNEGLRPRFRIGDQLTAVYSCTSEYLNLFLGAQGALLLGTIVLLFMGAAPKWVIRNITRHWFLLAPPVMGLLMYQSVHFEARYIAAFLTLFWMGLLAAVRLDDSAHSRRVAATVTILFVVLLMVRTATTQLGPTIKNLADAFKGNASRSHVYWQIADGLAGMGVRPGGQFAIIRTRSDAYYWARVAHVRVIAEMPGKYAADFWNSYGQVSAKVMEAFASAGAEGVVAPEVPPQARSGWRRIGATDYWVYFLRN